MPDPAARRPAENYIEAIEVLSGTRTRDKTAAAVRIQDLTGILQFPTTFRPVASAGGNPTQAEFNALVREVKQLYDALGIVANALQERLNP